MQVSEYTQFKLVKKLYTQCKLVKKLYSMQVSEEIIYSSLFSSQNPARLVMVIKTTSYLDPNYHTGPDLEIFERGGC